MTGRDRGHGGAIGELRDRANDRAAAFLFVHDLFRLPSPTQWEWLQRDTTRRPWEALASALDLPGPGDIHLPADERGYESEYLSAFEVGAPEPFAPLIESHYNKRAPVARVLHENVLFYQRFGLRIRDGKSERADHLRPQLEFVAHLYRTEGDEVARADGDGRLEPIQRGRRDFIERHLMSWLPAAEARAERAAPPWAAVYIAIARRLVEATTADSVPAAPVATVPALIPRRPEVETPRGGPPGPRRSESSRGRSDDER